MTTKILFISHGINDTGFGNVTKNTLKSLSKEFDVVSRTIEFQPSVLSNWFLELQEKDLVGVTHVIQYVLPEYFIRFPDVVNIGVMEIENEDLEHSTWIDHCEKMDQIWVSNCYAKYELSKQIDIPVHTVNHAVDMDLYKEDYLPINIPESQGTYVFYTIAEHNTRKNLAATIKAFHIEFDPDEPVTLLIKTDQNIVNYCIELKKSLELYPEIDDYKPEIIMAERFTDHQIYGLHELGDCYINTASGESWGQPVYDSQGFGNVAIFPASGGPNELTKEDIEKYCPNRMTVTPNIGLGGSIFKDTQNARTTCFMPNIKEICAKMRMAYNGELGIFDISQFDFDNYNKRVKELL